MMVRAFNVGPRRVPVAAGWGGGSRGPFQPGVVRRNLAHRPTILPSDPRVGNDMDKFLPKSWSRSGTWGMNGGFSRFPIRRRRKYASRPADDLGAFSVDRRASSGSSLFDRSFPWDGQGSPANGVPVGCDPLCGETFRTSRMIQRGNSLRLTTVWSPSHACRIVEVGKLRT